MFLKQLKKFATNEIKKRCGLFSCRFSWWDNKWKNGSWTFFDGQVTCVVGTHTHVPTADTRILNGGTAYQTDIGMCGDYNSVIGMNKENSIKRFFKDKDAKSHFPAEGEGTLSGVIVKTNFETGLAKEITRVIHGGSLVN